MLDLGSEAAWVLIPLGVTLFTVFFHVVKPLMPIMVLLPMLSIYEKHDCSIGHSRFCYQLCPYLNLVKIAQSLSQALRIHTKAVTNIVTSLMLRKLRHYFLLLACTRIQNKIVLGVGRHQNS